MIKNYILDPDKKPIITLTKEVLELWKSEKSFPIYYFTRLVYKNNNTSYKDYTSISYIKQLHNSTELHNEQTSEILVNKIKFNEFCVDNKLPAPKLIGLIEGQVFKNKELNLELSDSQVLLDIFKKLFEITKLESIFLKPVDGLQGKGCYRIDISTLSDKIMLAEIYKSIQLYDYIIQETVLQHPILNKINPYSINTIRMDTFIKDDNSVEVLSGLMRFGRKGSVVDNASSGGFFIPLDLKQGKLKKYGMRFLNLGNKYIYYHPDTKIKLEGYEIPYVKEAIELAKKAAILLGDRLVGWDIAITPSGPLLIEGNRCYDIGMQEMAYGGYKKHPVFREILQKFALNNHY